MNAALASNDFLVSSKSQRSFAMLFAIGLTLVMLAQFTLEFKPVSKTAEKAHTMLLTWIRPSLPKPEISKPAPPSAPIVVSNRPTRILSNQTKPIVPATTISAPSNSPVVNTEKPVSFDSVVESINSTTPASENLNTKKFDSRAARLAYEDSKSDIQKMAEASNKPMSTQKLSKHERFQQAADAAVKPDCVRQGGSILSIFVIAYQAATDHCK